MKVPAQRNLDLEETVGGRANETAIRSQCSFREGYLTRRENCLTQQQDHRLRKQNWMLGIIVALIVSTAGLASLARADWVEGDAQAAEKSISTSQTLHVTLSSFADLIINASDSSSANVYAITVWSSD